MQKKKFAALGIEHEALKVVVTSCKNSTTCLLPPMPILTKTTHVFTFKYKMATTCDTKANNIVQTPVKVIVQLPKNEIIQTEHTY